MHREIGNCARGQVVSQATPFAKSGFARLEAEVVYSEHICSGQMLFYGATRPVAEEQRQAL